MNTGIFDPSGEIELTSESRVQVLRGDTLLFSATPVCVLPGEGEGDPTAVLVMPTEAANQPVPAEWRNGVYLRTECFTFSNGGGWTARLNEPVAP